MGSDQQREPRERLPEPFSKFPPELFLYLVQFLSFLDLLSLRLTATRLVTALQPKIAPRRDFDRILLTDEKRAGYHYKIPDSFLQLNWDGTYHLYKHPGLCSRAKSLEFSGQWTSCPKESFRLFLTNPLIIEFDPQASSLQFPDQTICPWAFEIVVNEGGQIIQATLPSFDFPQKKLSGTWRDGKVSLTCEFVNGNTVTVSGVYFPSNSVRMDVTERKATEKNCFVERQGSGQGMIYPRFDFEFEEKRQKVFSLNPWKAAEFRRLTMLEYYWKLNTAGIQLPQWARTKDHIKTCLL